MRCPVTGMNMGVNEAGTDEFGAGLDHAINGTSERFSNMDDMAVFKCDNAVAQECMSAAVVSDDPLAPDQRSHPPLPSGPHSFDSLLALHPPAQHSPLFDQPKDHGFDGQADQDHGQQSGKHTTGLELGSCLENIPAEPTGPGGHAENKLCRNQRPPRERPANLQAGQNRRKGSRYQDERDVLDSMKAAIPAAHPQRLGNASEASQRIQRHRPQHRMNDDEDQRWRAEPEP